MASRSYLPKEDLICPVCFEIYKDPVVLTCSHSFCKTCLQDCWSDKFKECRNCPVCRKRFTLAEPPCNLALKNVCETVEEKGSIVLTESEVFCSLHNEKLKLFCLKDKEPICLVCQTSRKHRSHTCVPVDEAAQDHREEIQTALKPMEKKLEYLKKIKLTCDKTAGHIKTQANCTECRIKMEFKKLHQFLQQEEDDRISALKTEEKQKSEKINEKIRGINKEIVLLSDTIKAIKEELRAKDVLFLQKFEVTEKKTQVILPDAPYLVSGTLLDVAKHLGNLAFRVWEKMQMMVKHTPVILDPNTAAFSLSLSDDLTSVRQLDSKQQVPDNPERFTEYATVLGSEGFSSGKHSWEVEVGNNPIWTLGVSEESVNRIGELKAGTDYGLFALTQDNGTFTGEGSLRECFHLSALEKLVILTSPTYISASPRCL
ncbi:E3 ubiquitin-protein ligase TRIM35-like isoform X2 [Hypomesus transpacificus]|uniref:E3 ubiquitin-protein ligase TRIM35-like isoform X2 n=1 Tax=Hypomesus transpacificus TaxID=137520 RepID=UPI001F07A2C0|nr:E3 ubiquitin-protein ligase TRIM35-like isoform X2 [Hypomesus transpacificus]XP_046885724.1 E3 ubiquitin-protein ligase TRIM35-like isoform X2 [Hypomesus transpacificus]XP_046885725.1 E3 ubiquitin-protein ligase TRIM35-like isoform X2 [Hypomesus transpacificus]